jgi:hypothetical protein
MKFAIFAIAAFCASAASPVYGQSNWIKSHLGLGNAMLIYFGDDGKSIKGQLQALMRTDEFVEMGLSFRLLEPQSEDAIAVQQELGILPGRTWVLAERKGFSLLQGEAVPTSEMISQALEKAGIRGPIKLLRDFLKKHPDHLGAKIDLLRCLRELVEIRTIKQLKLDINTHFERSRFQDSSYDYLVQSMVNFDLVDIDTSEFRDKLLEAKDDLEIWGPYAQMLDSLFKSGEWRQWDGFDASYLLPLEASSQTMKTLYKRHLPLLEHALRERPLKKELWQTFGWMRSMCDEKGSIQSLLGTFPPSPDGEWTLPHYAKDLVLKEARKDNKWDDIADIFWKSYKDTVYNLYDQDREMRLRPDLPKQWIMAQMEAQRKTVFEPLLEVLIRASRNSDAEFIIFNVAKFPQNANFIQRAAEIANSCGLPELASKWSKLKVETTNRRDAGALEASLRYYGTPLLLLINVTQADRDAIRQALNQLIEADSLIEWRLAWRYFEKNEASEMMLKRENWYGNETRWALLNDELKVVFSGLGMPTENDVFKALEVGNIKSPTEKWRKVLKDHPDCYEALERLIAPLLRVATAKTKAKIGKTEDKSPTVELSADDDAAIWGEIAPIVRRLVTFLSCNADHYPLYSMTYEVYRYSPTMKTLAKELLPLISSAIRTRPEASSLWRLWVLLCDPSLDMQFSDFLNTVTASPFSNPLHIPNSWYRIDLMDKYKLVENWNGIINAFEPYVDKLKFSDEPVNLEELLANRPRGKNAMLLLSEAYINLNKEAKLKEWIGMWKESSEWGNLEPEIAKLYEKYNRTYIK